MRFAFESYVLDVGLRELRQDGHSVAVEPQVFDLIHHLICQRHRVVSKDELIEAVWNGRIVSESTLTSRLNAARKAIGDCGQEQTLIRTYPRRGVRFVGEVREQEASRAAPTAEGKTSSAALDRPALNVSRHPLVGDKPVIAVLPFKNLSPESDRGCLAQAVTEDVVTALSWHRSLTVCSPHYPLVGEGTQPPERHVSSRIEENVRFRPIADIQ